MQSTIWFLCKLIKAHTTLLRFQHNKLAYQPPRMKTSSNFIKGMGTPARNLDKNWHLFLFHMLLAKILVEVQISLHVKTNMHLKTVHSYELHWNPNDFWEAQVFSSFKGDAACHARFVFYKWTHNDKIFLSRPGCNAYVTKNASGTVFSLKRNMRPCKAIK